MRIWGVALGAAIAVSIVAPSRARADAPASESQTQADKLFVEGRALIAANKPAEACDKFEAAIKLDPTAAGIMLNLGVCYEALNKPKSALEWYRRTQARAAETNLPDYEAAAKDHTRTLAMIVPTVAIEFATPPPDGARVRIDGETLAATDFARIEVDPGHHVIDVRAQGKAPYRHEIDLALRGSQRVSITLVDGTSIVVLDPGKPRRHLALGIAGGGGLLWVATLVYGLHERTINKEDNNSIAKRNAAVSNLRDYGTTMFVVGAAAIGAAAYLYFTAPDKERVDETVFVPTLAPDQLGFAVTGSF